MLDRTRDDESLRSATASLLSKGLGDHAQRFGPSRIVAVIVSQTEKTRTHVERSVVLLKRSHWLYLATVRKLSSDGGNDSAGITLRVRELYQRRGFSAAGGPFENDAAALRQRLVDLLKRQHVGRLRAIRVKPHRCEFDERIHAAMPSRRTIKEESTFDVAHSLGDGRQVGQKSGELLLILVARSDRDADRGLGQWLPVDRAVYGDRVDARLE